MNLIPRRVAVLLLGALIAAGCAKGVAPKALPQPENQVAQQSSALVESSSTNSLQAEIARLEALVAREPSADTWSDLSHAHIQAGSWEAAAHAGSEALKLKRDHPYALYNIGLALVKQGKAMQALAHLKLTAALQPDRHEPPMVLAQAYEQLGHHLLASQYAQRALTLAKGDPEAHRTERSVASMLSAEPPAVLQKTCVQRLSDGTFSLCLYREPAPEQEVGGLGSAYAGHKYTLWYGPEGQAPRPIPVGYTDPGRMEMASMPGGNKGYWLPGGFVGAGVAGTKEWRLFIREGSDLRQVLFLGGSQYEGGSVSDFMRARTVPQLNGDQITSSHRDDVTGSRLIQTTRKISVANSTVTVEAESEIITGSLTQITPKVEVEAAYSYKWSYATAEGARIMLDGQSAKLSDLKVGAFVTIKVQQGLITELNASGR